MLKNFIKFCFKYTKSLISIDIQSNGDKYQLEPISLTTTMQCIYIPLRRSYRRNNNNVDVCIALYMFHPLNHITISS